jgi:uncharacterized protein (DUF1501 family)
VYVAQLGGFDTHADERGTRQRLLQTFDEAMTPFLVPMASDLKPTNDFRDIYYELLSRTVGTDPTPSVGTDRKALGFLA